MHLTWSNLRSEPFFSIQKLDTSTFVIFLFKLLDTIDLSLKKVKIHTSIRVRTNCGKEATYQYNTIIEKGGIMKKCTLLNSLIIIIMGVGMLSESQAETVSLWENYPVSQGDNGVFAYGYIPSTNTYRLLTETTNGFYTPETEWGAPGTYKGLEPNIKMWGSGTRSYLVQPEDVVLAWHATEAGIYHISGSFSAYDNSLSNGMDAYVKVNDNAVWSAYLPAGTTQSFSVDNLNLSDSDIIHFGAGAHNTNTFSELNDGMLLRNAIISYEPSIVIEDVYVDILPGTCPNSLNTKRKGSFKVAILGTESFDVTTIDPVSVKLAEISPIRSAIRDISSPYEASVESCNDCSTGVIDGYPDLVLSFDTQDVLSKLDSVEDGECIILGIQGSLNAEYGDIQINGEDAILINFVGH
jgi:hypothetical protein